VYIIAALREINRPLGFLEARLSAAMCIPLSIGSVFIPACRLETVCNATHNSFHALFYEILSLLRTRERSLSCFNFAARG
jgi:hypothetical protein